MSLLQDLLLTGLLVALLLVVRAKFFLLTVVSGQSMLPTLRNHTLLLVSRWHYRYHAPRRHELVICHYPRRYVSRHLLVPKKLWPVLRKLHIPQCFVKRIIALPGETIEIQEGVVLIDDEPLAEPFLAAELNQRPRALSPRTLGAEEYFVMGDNRDHSNDSRSVGAIHRSMLVGRVVWQVWPPKGFRSIE